MQRRDFIKGSIAGVASMYVPLSALSLEKENVENKIFLVSNNFKSGKYINNLRLNNKISRKNIVVLSSNMMKNLSLLGKIAKNNKNSLFSGILSNSDYVLFEQVIKDNKLKVLSEISHVNYKNKSKHTENSKVNFTAKKAFNSIEKINVDNYEDIISLYHLQNLNYKSSVRNNVFLSNHKMKSTSVSFIVKS